VAILVLLIYLYSVLLSLVSNLYSTRVLCGITTLIQGLLRIYIPSSASNSYLEPHGNNFTNSIVYEPLSIISLERQFFLDTCLESLYFNVKIVEP